MNVNMLNFIKIKLGKKCSKKRKRERSLHFCMQAKQLQKKKYNLDQPIKNRVKQGTKVMRAVTIHFCSTPINLMIHIFFNNIQGAQVE